MLERTAFRDPSRGEESFHLLKDDGAAGSWHQLTRIEIEKRYRCRTYPPSAARNRSIAEKTMGVG
jgi:hypothetical protein